MNALRRPLLLVGNVLLIIVGCGMLLSVFLWLDAERVIRTRIAVSPESLIKDFESTAAILKGARVTMCVAGASSIGVALLNVGSIPWRAINPRRPPG